MTTTDPSRIAGLIFAWGVGGIATLIGLVGVLTAAWDLRQGNASESWPQVTGQIVTSMIGSSSHRQPNGGAARSGSRDTDYSVEVRYAYQVDGQTYKGHRIRFGSNRYDRRSGAQKVQRQFPKGKNVPVYYHPEKPDRSTLVRGAEGNWGRLIGLSICLVVGLGLLFLAVRSTLRLRIGRA